MRVLRRVLLLLLVVAVAGAVFVYREQRPLIATGTGYAVHNSCALTFLAGRDDTDADLPPNPLVPYLTGYVNKAGKSSTAAALWLFEKQKAWYRPGYGCTVAPERPQAPEPATVVNSDANPYGTQSTPEPFGGVVDAIGRAFGDDRTTEEREALGTRAVVVIRDGELIGERYAEGFDAQTRQLGWSMAKSATNLVVGRYVHDRGLSVEESGLRPEWTDERADITVDQLMRMTSGLSWDETYALGTPITQMLYSEPDMAAYAAGRPLAYQPGTHQQYSSGSTNILCGWLTSLADVPDADFPRRTLFAPLGLSSAVWEPDAAGRPVCSSYLWASPRDWAALGQFALQDGVWNDERLLPEGWMTQSTTVTGPAETEDPGYAAGWWSNRLPDGSLVNPDLPEDTYWASGHDGQRLYVVPSAGLVVVRLGFSPEVEPADLGADELVRDLAALPTDDGG
ncbi:serine hydrolase [Phycicoccus sp. CSK15P-2]|uniref:serine hydrolase domain-containing protein n=1 Tax=Phycicoccus sp. CSK15P-2 TaxID=2807627 RepID=UPI0019505ABD|nr:serine hydrolase [Phycicoccus sp. CSK15P-2]MBM6406130.1 serine hydrolase [Phycicoccus sp. CSK15P-2]